MRGEPTPVPNAITATIRNFQIVQDRIAADRCLELRDQAIIRERLQLQYHGDIPAPVLWEMRAERLGSVC